MLLHDTPGTPTGSLVLDASESRKVAVTCHPGAGLWTTREAHNNPNIQIGSVQCVLPRCLQDVSKI